MLSSPSPLKQEKESPVPSTAVQALLGGCLELCEVFVLSGLLRLTPVEARMKMESGGALRQGLRLGRCMCMGVETLFYFLDLPLTYMCLWIVQSRQCIMFRPATLLSTISLRESPRAPTHSHNMHSQFVYNNKNLLAKEMCKILK